jgi:endonuclease-8
MPEGDSLHRLASKLAPVLEAREVLAFSARRLTSEVVRSIVGQRIESVTAKGKNLLIRLGDGRMVHIHLRMEGRVVVERPRSTFWAPERAEPDLRLVVPGASIVGRRIAVLRLLSSSQATQVLRAERAHVESSREGVLRAPDLAGLGPDLVREGWNEAEAVRRLRTLPSNLEIADATLVQRAVAGIGNVYKSEVLFLEGVHPRTLVSSISDDALRSLLRRASDLLRRNLGHGPRTTRPTLGGARLWVYGRGGRPCLQCSASIVRVLQGSVGPRSTYYCPQCQPERGTSTKAQGKS